MAVEIEEMFNGELPESGFCLHFIGVDVEDDEECRQVVAALNRAMKIIDDELDPLFEERLYGPGPPPHAGGGFDLVLLVKEAVVSGLVYDLIKKVFSPLWRAMAEARSGGAWLELGGEGLKVLAMAEATRMTPAFETDPAVIRCTADFEMSDMPESAGLFAFLLPDLHAQNTHVVVMDRRGHVHLHQILPVLSEDARCFIDEADGWSWTAPDGGWSW